MICQGNCGGWTIDVPGPDPAWVTLSWGTAEIPGLTVKDLRDLRHLIDLAERAIVARGAA